MAPPKTVMLIDDSDTDNYLHMRAIRKTGLVENVVVFDYAEKALEYLTEERREVDLILLDINMPRMNGFEFLDAYQRLPPDRVARTVVMMLTTSISESDQEKAARYKAVSDYLHKPLTPTLLTELFERHFVAS